MTKRSRTIVISAVAGLCLLSLGATAATASIPEAKSKPKKSTSAVDPNAPEVVEPGDIPDDQVFVVFRPTGGGYSIKVPEGWSRTEKAGIITFTDKYNSIAVSAASAAKAPTVESVKALVLADVAGAPSYKLGKVNAVRTAGGAAIHAAFEMGSAPNAVTGKRVLLAVERYVYFAQGTQVVVTLSGAKGADNVDPWKIVSDSVRLG